MLLKSQFVQLELMNISSVFFENISIWTMKEVRKIYPWCLQKKHYSFTAYCSISTFQIDMFYEASGLLTLTCNRYFCLSSGTDGHSYCCVFCHSETPCCLSTDCLPTRRETIVGSSLCLRYFVYKAFLLVFFYKAIETHRKKVSTITRCNTFLQEAK